MNNWFPALDNVIMLQVTGWVDGGALGEGGGVEPIESMVVPDELVGVRWAAYRAALSVARATFPSLDQNKYFLFYCSCQINSKDFRQSFF